MSLPEESMSWSSQSPQSHRTRGLEGALQTEFSLFRLCIMGVNFKSPKAEKEIGVLT